VVLDSTRDANSARLRISLQAGRDIDGIAEQIVALNDNIADVDADPELHLITGRSISVFPSYGLLNFDGAFDGIHGAAEIGNNAVARGVEDPTAMRGDQAIDDDPVGREGLKGADLISPHQAAVAFDIGCENRR